MTKTEILLHRLGVRENLHGNLPICMAVSMALEDEDCLGNVQNRVYPQVAKQCGCTPTALERNIRTVAKSAWKHNPVLLQKIAHGTLHKAPASRQFLTILFAYIARNEILP